MPLTLNPDELFLLMHLSVIAERAGYRSHMIMKTLEKLEETEVRNPADWCHIKVGQVVLCSGHSYLDIFVSQEKEKQDGFYLLPSSICHILSCNWWNLTGH